MKYVLLFAAGGEDASRFDAMTEDERAAGFARVGAWFAANQSRIIGGRQLAHPTTATTVRFQPDGGPLVTDGPFIEGNEVIGGYAEVEVADLDEALTMAKTWPPGGLVEVRPVWEQAAKPEPAEKSGHAAG
jgi:hypothetical protein